MSVRRKRESKRESKGWDRQRRKTLVKKSEGAWEKSVPTGVVS